MPQGEVAAAPPGFLDLCQRDASACGANGADAAPAIALTSAPLATSSLGGPTDPQVLTRLRGLHLGGAPQEETTGLAQVEQLDAYRPIIDNTFVAVGGERVQTAQAAVAPAPLASNTGPAVVSKSLMRLVNTLNRDVNREVLKASDFDLYGLQEFWSLPRVIDGKMYGDCEDYALEKRRRLIAAGVPAEALSMAVAVTARGETHAVLVVSFESGDWVLDNLTPWATPWNELNYHWVERQVPGSTEWKSIT
ncbi:transglutaminase-like cysteine peptidase [Caulobacter soli]|uniref:transglutaminase-like cysteine peptidase n=1 Tax=Caulobacter soli TaxID=2708539 RepID=UPI001FE6FD3C|nr:transglutaminase-like cysteine peptidase [Caulobacter soli]